MIATPEPTPAATAADELHALASDLLSVWDGEKHTHGAGHVLEDAEGRGCDSAWSARQALEAVVDRALAIYRRRVPTAGGER